MGGQSVPMFDYYLAPYVALSYAKTIAHVAKLKLDLKTDVYKELKSRLVALQNEHKLIMGKDKEDDIKTIITDVLGKYNIKCSEKRINKILKDAYDDTYDETFQSMEAFVHNLNTMHSRAGRGANMVDVPVTWETLCSAV